MNTRQIITIVPGSVYQAVYMSSASLDIVPLSIFMNFQAFIDFNDLKMIYNCEIYMGLGKFEMFSHRECV